MSRRPIVQKRGQRIDDDYRHWIQAQPCVSPSPLTGAVPCGQDVEAAHLKTRGMGGGSRDDRMLVPLCGTHHRGEIHGKGELYPMNPEQTEAFMVWEALQHLLRYMDQEGRMVAPL